jgi:hypothetical protein
VLDEIDERIEGLCCQRYSGAIAVRKQSPAPVQPEVAEFEHVQGGGAHGLSYLLRKLQAYLRTGEPRPDDHLRQEGALTLKSPHSFRSVFVIGLLLIPNWAHADTWQLWAGAPTSACADRWS